MDTAFDSPLTRQLIASLPQMRVEHLHGTCRRWPESLLQTAGFATAANLTVQHGRWNAQEEGTPPTPPLSPFVQ